MDREEYNEMKNAYSLKRANELRKIHERKLAKAEEYGYPYYGSDECVCEEADEEFDRMYGFLLEDDENE